MSMNANEMKAEARKMTMQALMEALLAQDAVRFADGSFAILQVVDGQEIWTEVSIKSKAYKDTKVSKAFDPYEEAEAWKQECALKEKKRKEKELERATRKAEKGEA